MKVAVVGTWNGDFKLDDLASYIPEDCTTLVVEGSQGYPMPLVAAFARRRGLALAVCYSDPTSGARRGLLRRNDEIIDAADLVLVFGAHRFDDQGRPDRKVQASRQAVRRLQLRGWRGHACGAELTMGEVLVIAAIFVVVPLAWVLLEDGPVERASLGSGGRAHPRRVGRGGKHSRDELRRRTLCFLGRHFPSSVAAWRGGERGRVLRARRLRVQGSRMVPDGLPRPLDRLRGDLNVVVYCVLWQAVLG